MVNIPRALCTGRTGREPRYHIAIEQCPDWFYKGNPQLIRRSGTRHTADAETAARGWRKCSDLGLAEPLMRDNRVGRYFLLLTAQCSSPSSRTPHHRQLMAQRNDLEF
jgi:hypothetical protein